MNTIEFFPTAAKDLPSSPGVIMVCCPHGLNAKTSKIISLLETENVRQLVESRAISWATECETGYLEYLVAMVNNPAERSALLEKTRKLHNVGN